MVVKIGEYQGKALVQFMKNEDDDFAIIQMGARKLQAIVDGMVEHPELVIAFLEAHGGEKGVESANKFRQKYNMPKAMAAMPQQKPAPKKNAAKAPKTEKV